MIHLILKPKKHKKGILKTLKTDKKNHRKLVSKKSPDLSSEPEQKVLFDQVTSNERLMTELASLPKEQVSRNLLDLGFLKTGIYQKLLMGLIVGTGSGLGGKLLYKFNLNHKIKKLRKAALNIGVKNLAVDNEAMKIAEIKMKLKRTVNRITDAQQLLETNIDSRSNSIKV